MLHKWKRDAEDNAAAGIKAIAQPAPASDAPPIAALISVPRAPHTPYYVGNPGQVLRANIHPIAERLVSELRGPRRSIIVAPYCAPETLLRREVILATVASSRVCTKLGAPFPPMSTESGDRREANGLVWKTVELEREFAIGFDASFATRDRTVEDRAADGRSQAGGVVGIFTTMELVLGAILFVRKLDRCLARHPRWWMRVELMGMSGRNLIFDPPGPRRFGSPWAGRLMTATAEQIAVEANFPADQHDDEIIAFGNEIAGAIAYSFKAEGPVKALQVGRLILDDVLP